LTPGAVVHVAKHRPLVVCGPSGVGKGTLLTRLLKEYPHVFAKSVSHTTRAPRAGEENGVHYHFTQPADLLQSVSDGHFIEHANVHGNYYGTSISSVAHVMDSGKICLLEIDIQGVLSVKRVATLHPLSVFIRAPTFEDLVNRLNRRGSETEQTMQKRLDTARNEMDFFYTNRHMFEADIINADFDDSYVKLIDTIQKLYPNVKLTPPGGAEKKSEQ
jgi:guanylate kinase